MKKQEVVKKLKQIRDCEFETLQSYRSMGMNKDDMLYMMQRSRFCMAVEIYDRIMEEYNA